MDAKEPGPAMDAKEPTWKCCRCDRELVMKRVVFEYLGHTVAHEVPACPACGKVYVSKELADGRMGEVEQTLEDK
jgi:hypothetical protein